MAETTGITWTDATWNPVTGCSRVSTGCINCYAERLAATRLRDQPKYKGLTTERGQWNGEVKLHPTALREPFHWKKPRLIFTCSMGDLLHEKVPMDFIGQTLEVMRQTPWHTYQVLSKRPERMVEAAAMWGWPDNAWAGTGVENQDCTGRLDHLVRVPAKVRFVSVEPMLGPVNLTPYFFKCPHEGKGVCNCQGLAINQVIVGGESGPRHRPMDLAWLESLANQCDHVGAALFVKQDAGSRPGQQGRIPAALWARKEMP